MKNRIVALSASLALLAGGTVLGAAPVADAAAPYTTYTVKRGDTLSRIAASHRTTVRAIATASGITNVNVLKVGQKLRIPTAGTTPAAPRPVATPQPAARGAVIATRVIGKSSQGRSITAYLVGDPKAKVTQMVIGNMHGNEPRSDDTAYAIINGPKVKGVKIWVIPSINPDGLVRGTRTNARGVDLNANFPQQWRRGTPGSRYYGGPRPMSEVESRNIHAFVQAVRPTWIVSIHQPLNGIDTGGVKSKALQQNLLTYTGLPTRYLSKTAISHGTMVDHINATTSSAAITIEYSASPTRKQTDVTYRNGVVRALGGSY